MHIDTMRWMDAVVGRPLCGVLTLLRHGLDFLGRKPSGPVRSVLILKLAEQGSTVLARDALAEAARRYGRENVYFLLFAENRFILDYLGLFQEKNILEVRTDSLPVLVRDLIVHLLFLRKIEGLAAIDFEFFARSTAILSYLSGAVVRCGFHPYFEDGPWRGDLLTHRVQFNPHQHTRESFLNLVDIASEDPERLPCHPRKPESRPETEVSSFQCEAGLKMEAESILKNAFGMEIEGKTIILLNCNCSDLLPLRRWPDENYLALAERLLKEEIMLVGFTGSASEREGAEELVNQVNHTRCASVAGKTTLPQLMALYSLSDVLVTNDSGPAHFSSLTPIQSVVLFGPETPRLFGVSSSRSQAIWKQLPCSPCVSAYNNRQSACRDNQCLKQITVEEVHDAVMEALSKRSR